MFLRSPYLRNLLNDNFFWSSFFLYWLRWLLCWNNVYLLDMIGLRWLNILNEFRLYFKLLSLIHFFRYWIVFFYHVLVLSILLFNWHFCLASWILSLFYSRFLLWQYTIYQVCICFNINEMIALFSFFFLNFGFLFCVFFANFDMINFRRDFRFLFFLGFSDDLGWFFMIHEHVGLLIFVYLFSFVRFLSFVINYSIWMFLILAIIGGLLLVGIRLDQLN